MGSPRSALTFGVRERSTDNRLYARYPLGDKPIPTGAGVIATTSAASGSASGGSGGGSPAAGDSNINFATQNITGTPAILDLRQNYNLGGRDNVLWLGGVERLATCTYMPAGGFYGTGCNRFVPGRNTSDPINNPAGDHPAGIGQILGFNAVGGGSAICTVGVLWRYGSGLINESNGIKSIILLRGALTRPMIIPKGPFAASDPGTLVLPPCDGTICNASESILPEGEENYFNSPPVTLPDISAAWPWMWTEMSIDCTQTPPLMHIRNWFADSSELGTHVLKKRLYEDDGGIIDGIDIVNYVNSVTSPSVNCWTEVERLEIHVGQFGPITPPAGFPGSTR